MNLFKQMFLVLLALACASHAAAQQPNQPSKRVAGKLTLQGLQEPFNVANRSSYCLDALMTSTGAPGGRTATAEDKDAIRKWRTARRMSIFWAAVYGGFSLVDLHDQNAGVHVPGGLKVQVPDDTLGSCASDLEFLRANLPRVIQDVYQKNVQAVNWQRRAYKTEPVHTRDIPLVAGWCETILNESRAAVRERPVMFGYRSDSANHVAGLTRVTARLSAAADYWRRVGSEIEQNANGLDALDKVGYAAGGDNARQTRRMLVESVNNPQGQERALGSWLVTESNMCAMIADPDSQDIAMPQPSAGTANRSPAAPGG